MRELPKVETIPASEVAKLLKTSPSKVHAAIANGTFPVGLAIDSGSAEKNRTIIIKSRLIAWLNADDLMSRDRDDEEQPTIAPSPPPQAS